MKKTQILMAELALIVASVFVFRGLWTLLDRLHVMNQPGALWLSLIVGSAVAVWMMHVLMNRK